MVYPLKVRTNNWSICGLGVEINTPLWIPSQQYALTCTNYQGYFGNEWYLKQFGRKNRSAIALNKLLNLHLGSTRKPEHDIEYTYLKKKNWYRTYTKRFKDVKLLLKRYSYITASLLTVVSKKSKYTCQLQRLLKTER